MRLKDLIRVIRGQAESRKSNRVRVELLNEEFAEEEQDVGALRLTILEAALKEKRILESKG